MKDEAVAPEPVEDPAPAASAADALVVELATLRAQVHLAERLLASPAVIERDGERQYLVVLSESEWAAWNGLGS